jgi:hypothetical protein
MRKFIIIDTGYACFGLISEDGVIVEAPPIAKWTIDKKEKFVINYYRKMKNARVRTIDKVRNNHGIEED